MREVATYTTQHPDDRTGKRQIVAAVRKTLEFA